MNAFGVFVVITYLKNMYANFISFICILSVSGTGFWFLTHI
jgi:hypothetical protein